MKKKIALMVTSLVLVVAMAVGGTLAYLTSNDSVTNTFTVGGVTITLDETDVDLYGVKESDERNDANSYKLIPGHTYVKDPIIHVASGSEACYVYAKVVNEISAIEATGKTIDDQMKANGWAPISVGSNVYYIANVIDARNAAQDVALFSTFSVATDAPLDNTYENKTIQITAYAIQADGFTDALNAWNTGAPTEWKS